MQLQVAYLSSDKYFEGYIIFFNNAIDYYEVSALHLQKEINKLWILWNKLDEAVIHSTEATKSELENKRDCVRQLINTFENLNHAELDKLNKLEETDLANNKTLPDNPDTDILFSSSNFLKKAFTEGITDDDIHLYKIDCDFKSSFKRFNDCCERIILALIGGAACGAATGAAIGGIIGLLGGPVVIFSLPATALTLAIFFALLGAAAAAIPMVPRASYLFFAENNKLEVKQVLTDTQGEAAPLRVLKTLAAATA